MTINHLEQSGAKLMGFGSARLSAGADTGEKVSILPMPTNYKTDTVNLALNWLGDKGHATVSYFGSFFRDNYNGVKFQTCTNVLKHPDDEHPAKQRSSPTEPDRRLCLFGQDETGRRPVVRTQYPEYRLRLRHARMMVTAVPDRLRSMGLSQPRTPT